MARSCHGYGENIERGIGKSNVVKKKGHHDKTGIRLVQD